MRFPGFTDDWKKVTVQDVAIFSNGKAHENYVNEFGKYILVNSKFISSDGAIYKRVSTQLSPLNKNQFVMVMSDLPNGKALAKCYYIEDDNTYTLNQRICSFTALDDNDSRFLMYQVNRNKYYLRFDDGINQTNLKKEEVLSCPISLPAKEEQKTISTFLGLLDERIATQNKIIDNLRSLIKGLAKTHYDSCQTLHTVKIRDLGNPYTVMNLSKEQLSGAGQSCILYGELFTLYGPVIDKVISKTNVMSNLTLSSGRDLLFPSSTTVDALSLIAPSALTKPNVILGGDMFGIKVSDEYSPEYLSYYFNYVGKRDLAKYAIGSTIIHLHYKDIAEHIIKIPSLSEQKAFVKLASLVKHKIDAEQFLFYNLTSLKSYLLQKIFI